MYDKIALGIGRPVIGFQLPVCILYVAYLHFDHKCIHSREQRIQNMGSLLYTKNQGVMRI